MQFARQRIPWPESPQRVLRRRPRYVQQTNPQSQFGPAWQGFFIQQKIAWHWTRRRGRRPLVVESHLEAFFWILRTGDPWREVPERFGKWQTVYSQFRRWGRCGLWDALLKWFGTRALGVLRFVDGSYIKLHQHGLQGAATLRPQEAIGLSRGGWTTKVVAVVDEAGLLCGALLAPGNQHYQTASRACRRWREAILWATRVLTARLSERRCAKRVQRP